MPQVIIGFEMNDKEGNEDKCLVRRAGICIKHLNTPKIQYFPPTLFL